MGRPQVYFVHGHSSVRFGSTIVRAVQLCEIARQHLGEQYEFNTLVVPWMKTNWRQSLWVRRRRPAVYIFVKDAIDRLSREHLAALRKRALAICVDYVDRSLSKVFLESVDMHISASVAGHRAIASLAGGDKAALVLHHVDTRLPTGWAPPHVKPRTVYFGGPGNVVFSDYSRTVVDVLPAELSQQAAINFPRLKDYNSHYAVRPERNWAETGRSFAPFTKGFIAAACASNILVNRHVDDAVHFLGEDYPFLIETAVDQDIDNGLRAMREGFGGREWLDGLERMANVRENTRPAVVAAQLATALGRVLS